MVSEASQKTVCTYADYLQTPEGERYELIEGELYMTPAPATYHQWLSKNIEFELELHIRKTAAGKVFYAPCDVYIDEHTVVQPDILMILAERLSIIEPQRIAGAPDLIVEILSKSSAYHDLVQKKRIYAQAGVKEYWVVDQYERTVCVYRSNDSAFELVNQFAERDTLTSPLLPELSIELEGVFAF